MIEYAVKSKILNLPSEAAVAGYERSELATRLFILE